jgi:ribosome-binding protein aMBF1 (putative translation factor)
MNVCTRCNRDLSFLHDITVALIVCCVKGIATVCSGDTHSSLTRMYQDGTSVAAMKTNAARADTQLLRRLGRKIHDVRVGKDVSRVELARRTGFHPSSFSRIEHGLINLRYSSIVRIARHLNVPPSSLIAE